MEEARKSAISECGIKTFYVTECWPCGKYFPLWKRCIRRRGVRCRNQQYGVNLRTQSDQNLSMEQRKNWNDREKTLCLIVFCLYRFTYNQFLQLNLPRKKRKGEEIPPSYRGDFLCLFSWEEVDGQRHSLQVMTEKFYSRQQAPGYWPNIITEHTIRKLRFNLQSCIFTGQLK